MITQKALQLGHEIIHILEFPINRRKAYIGDVIQVVQLGHGFLTDNRGGQFLFADFTQVSFQVVNKFFDNIHADVTFLTGLFYPATHLFPVKDLATPVLFNDHDGNLFNVLVGCKPTAAINAFPAPSNRTGILAQPGIDYLVISFAAIRTFHEPSP